MFLAGNAEQPGRAVRRAEVMADAVPLDTSHGGASLRQSPQCRGAERAEADNDHVFTDDIHHRHPIDGHGAREFRRAADLLAAG